MPVPEALTPFVRFLAGISYIPGGAFFLFRNPRLWTVALSPLIVAAGLLVVGVFSGAFWAGRIEQALFGAAFKSIPSWLSFVVVSGLWVGSLAAGAIIALAIAFALVGPLFEKLSQRVEEISGRAVRGGKGLRWEIVQSLKTAGYFALGAPVAILLGLIPFLGPLLALGFTGHRVAFQNTDAVLLRRGMDFLERHAFHRRFRAETMGFGVGAVLLFPLMNVLAVPIFVVGATRLVNELEQFGALGAHPSSLSGESHGDGHDEVAADPVQQQGPADQTAHASPTRE